MRNNITVFGKTLKYKNIYWLYNRTLEVRTSVEEHVNLFKSTHVLSFNVLIKGTESCQHFYSNLHYFFFTWELRFVKKIEDD